jgi:hypothetical protein
LPAFFEFWEKGGGGVAGEEEDREEKGEFFHESLSLSTSTEYGILEHKKDIPFCL